MSTQPLWTPDAMASAMQAQAAGTMPAAVHGLSIDSRTIAPGDAYFAIKGDVHDGHAFVEVALKAGAALAVVSRDKRDQFAADAPLLVVEDVLQGLVDLAKASRARLGAKVIAVTGSVGKTSTKEMLRHGLDYVIRRELESPAIANDASLPPAGYLAVRSFLGASL